MPYPGDKPCPTCGQKYSSKRRCEKCGQITCGKCQPQTVCPCGGKKSSA